MATITDSFTGINNFQFKTYNSSKTITTGDTYEVTLNSSFPVFWNNPIVSGSQTVSLISGGGSSSSQAVYRVTNLASGSQSVTVLVNQSGGGGSTGSATVNFTVSAPSITAPVISSVTNNNASASSVTTTVNLSSTGSGGTLKYAQTTSNSVPATGWQTSANFTHPRNGTRYYWASRDEDTSGTFDSSGAVYVGYIAPDTNISVSRSPTGNLAHDYTGNVTVTVSNGTVGDRYRVLRTTGGNLGCGNTGNLTGTSGTISLDYSVSGELPPVGSTYSYTIQARRDTANGGDGAYDNTGTNFSITRNTESVTTPTDIVFGTSSTASATVSITATASGGSGGTLQVSENNSTWVANGSSFTFTRGTAKTIYARRTGSGSTSSSYSESHTVGYLQPDLGVAATSSTIAFTANSASTTISGGQSAETYAVRVNNGATNLATRTGNGSVSFTSSLPSGGNTTTYEIFARRPESTGGDGSTFYATNDTFTVTRTAQDSTPNAFTFTDATGVARSTTQTSNQITITGITGSVSVSVSGGTYSKNGGSYTSSAGTASVNDTFRVRHTSSSSYETAVNTTLTVGTVSDTFTTTTLASGSGGGGSVGGGTSNYGIEVYDTNGTTKVLSSATRYLNALSDVTTYTFAASGNSGSTYDILLDMTDLTTSNSDVYFITGDIVITTSRLSDRFRLTNTGQSSVSASFVVIRF